MTGASKFSWEFSLRSSWELYRRSIPDFSEYHSGSELRSLDPSLFLAKNEGRAGAGDREDAEMASMAGRKGDREEGRVFDNSTSINI